MISLHHYILTPSVYVRKHYYYYYFLWVDQWDALIVSTLGSILIFRPLGFDGKNVPVDYWNRYNLLSLSLSHSLNFLSTVYSRKHYCYLLLICTFITITRQDTLSILGWLTDKLGVEVGSGWEIIRRPSCNTAQIFELISKDEGITCQKIFGIFLRHWDISQIFSEKVSRCFWHIFLTTTMMSLITKTLLALICHIYCIINFRSLYLINITNSFHQWENLHLFVSKYFLPGLSVLCLVDQVISFNRSWLENARG